MLQTEQEQGGPKGLMPCLEYWFLSTARDEAQQNPQCESAGSNLNVHILSTPKMQRAFVLTAGVVAVG